MNEGLRFFSFSFSCFFDLSFFLVPRLNQMGLTSMTQCYTVRMFNGGMYVTFFFLSELHCEGGKESKRQGKGKLENVRSRVGFV